MDVSSSAWFVIVLAAFAANMPFLNQRFFCIFPLKQEAKPFWMRLIELAVLYVATGLVAYGLESRAGNVFSQGWEFYAITICLFIVLAFPGFVYRYLRPKHA
ncbi:MAG: DUF2818 family protein [Burkholderiaceae bacterium]